MLALRTLLVFGLAVSFAGCAGSADRQGFEANPDAGDDTPPPASTGDFGTEPPPPPPETPEVHEVYGQSATTLYKLEPATKAVTVVGPLKGCEPIIDMALDEKSTLFAVSRKTLYTVDKNTAACTQVHTIQNGEYPTSLSFVPKGTVDPNEEALVGYQDSDYVRIDVKNGSLSIVGSLGDGKLISSGDIASVKGGKTYLTVKASGKSEPCKASDCLVEVDPKTGKMLKNWGSVEHSRVFGLSFWGGNVYGFDDKGNLFEVVFGSNKIVTKTIPIPQKPTDLSFWGAGSSTSAPLVAGPQ